MLNGHLMYKNTSLVISSNERQQVMMHDVHVGLRNDSKEKTKTSYRGGDIQLNKKLGKGFFGIKLKVTLNNLSRSAINTKNRENYESIGRSSYHPCQSQGNATDRCQ